jgi:hypothetical protein
LRQRLERQRRCGTAKQRDDHATVQVTELHALPSEGVPDSIMHWLGSSQGLLRCGISARLTAAIVSFHQLWTCRRSTRTSCHSALPSDLLIDVA